MITLCAAGEQIRDASVRMAVALYWLLESHIECRGGWEASGAAMGRPREHRNSSRRI